MRSATLVALLTALALSGCESNIERSARLEGLHKHVLAQQRGLTVARENPHVKVISAVALHDENGTAAVIELRNTSGTALRDVPIAITARNASGTVLYRNNAPGLEATLTSVALLEPGAQTTWIDDQVQAASTVAHVEARVGEASTVSGRAPRLSIQGAHPFEDPSNGEGEEGIVANRSTVTQQQLVIYAVARRAGHLVAAGRAVLPEVPAGQSTPFQVFFIGNPKGVQIEYGVPPTTLG